MRGCPVSKPKFYVAEFSECAGISSVQDVIEMFELLRPLGLALGVGAWGYKKHPSPTNDIPATLAEGYHDWHFLRDGETEPPKGAAEPLDRWIRGLLWVEQPYIFAGVHVNRRADDHWDVWLDAASSPISLENMAITLADFAQRWGSVLEEAGTLLYRKLRPAIGLICGIGDADWVDFVRPALARRLSIGWRAWFGPAYVERYGRDWLRGLPGRTAELDDGGVAHALDASAVELITGANVYAGVWPYLEAAGITPYWPRKRKRSPREAGSRARRDNNQTSRKQATTAMDQPGLLEAATTVADMMATSLVLDDGWRTKMLFLDWDNLSAGQRDVAVQQARLQLEAELLALPGAKVALEIGVLAPALRSMLDDLAGGVSGRLAYREVAPDDADATTPSDWPAASRDSDRPQGAHGVSPNDHMARQAALAQTIIRDEFGGTPDYSESSVDELEKLLSGFHEALVLRSSAEARDRADRMAYPFGAYLGEVIHRQHGGEWVQTDYGIGLQIGNSTFYPTAKAAKRVLDGPGDNVVVFYKRAMAYTSR